ncbi:MULTISPECIES: hypothetical protein [unclassified Methylibium]|uniref:hypothetical protein n=1 Tax=unclassified Methylibium TaxID=2633235 RepID=UPI0003F3EC80|nr:MULTISPECIES: hypothetical protein [unclassified Methylibium]EWS56057.1 hypothetical protein X551_01098 [Methylibium sp. T29]EWS60458.1 hypothetical protein Y694_01783 [Methylibium sp. T29-B]
MRSQAPSSRPASRTGSSSSATHPSGDLALYALLLVLTLATWHLSTSGYFETGDDIGYWLGVGGGVAMLLLFGYPLRKYLPGMRRWGKVKWWFWAHMTLGIGGPVLILAHTTFHVGSLNAAVALYSMVIVALSGVVGRFLYVRIHHGLSGEKSSLQELQARAGLDGQAARSRLQFAPKVEAQLLGFHQETLATGRDLRHVWRLLFVLPCRQWRVYRQCCKGLDEAICAASPGRPAEEMAARRRQLRKLIGRYLAAVVRVAQFSAYERVFALWHVAHVPFVYLLVVSATVHVVAVHAY